MLDLSPPASPHTTRRSWPNWRDIVLILKIAALVYLVNFVIHFFLIGLSK
jgi:hypothetical protein